MISLSFLIFKNFAIPLMPLNPRDWQSFKRGLSSWATCSDALQEAAGAVSHFLSEAESKELESVWVYNLVLPFPSCEVLGKLCNLLETQTFHLESGS